MKTLRALLLQIIAAAAFTGAVHAATALHVHSMSFKGKNEAGRVFEKGEIKMPFVQATNPAVAAKINDRMFIEHFGVLAPRERQEHFGAADGVSIVGTEMQTFAEGPNDGRILTVNFEIEGCGNNCTLYATSYSFDAATGRFLSANELFTRSGMRDLAKRIRAEKDARHRSQIASLRKELRSWKGKKEQPANEGWLSDLEERIELNNDCLTGRMGGTLPKTDAAFIETFRYQKYSIGDKGITFTSERCAPRALQALDDVGEVALSIPFPQLRPYLTPYAKALLLNEGTGTRVNTVYGQLLRGRLGKGTAITMLLHKGSDNAVGGAYFYDRVRKPIELSGRQDGDKLELKEHEQADRDKIRATMHLTITGSRLTGRWEGQQQFAIEVAE